MNNCLKNRTLSTHITQFKKIVTKKEMLVKIIHYENSNISIFMLYQHSEISEICVPFLYLS